MSVEIDLDRSVVSDDGLGGWLVLVNPEKEIDYASWPFSVPSERDQIPDANEWDWKNPDDSLEDITLSPSLKLEWDDDKYPFHIFIRGGDVDHCGDCKCGCSS